MRTPRVVLPSAEPEGEFALSAADSRHLTVVLRRSPGDAVDIVGAGVVLPANICRVDSDGTVWLRAGDVLRSAPPSRAPWTVSVALVKGNAMDSAVRIASELGLDAIVPLIAERCQVRADSGRPARWARIAEESAKQCGRVEPLRVGAVATVAETLDRAESAAVWIATPAASGADPLRAFDREPCLGPTIVLVGPEGGFSAAELELASSRGAHPLAFPTPVLRTPTAVVLVAALRILAWSQGSARRSPE